MMEDCRGTLPGRNRFFRRPRAIFPLIVRTQL
jgi:hypothetical protein